MSCLSTMSSGGIFCRHWPGDRQAAEAMIQNDLENLDLGRTLTGYECWRRYSTIRNSYIVYLPVALQDYACRALADRLKL